MNKNEFIEMVFTLHLQNTNGRESHEEMFRLGIEAAYKERLLLNEEVLAEGKSCGNCRHEEIVSMYRRCAICRNCDMWESKA
jgi:hypothetical protein